MHESTIGLSRTETIFLEVNEEMTVKTHDKANAPHQKTDLASQYRPLGLKAVLAAALMLKPVAGKKRA